jgi:LysM repeat protein
MQRLALGETLEGGGESVMSIQAGDTLSAFAERFDTSVQALMGINPKIDDPNLIYAGEQLNVPLDNARKNIEAMNEGITTITSRQHNININMNVTSDDVSPGVVNSLTEKMMERYGDLQ